MTQLNKILENIKLSYNTIYTKVYYYVCPDGYKISAVVSDTYGYVTEREIKEILAEKVLEYLQAKWFGY